MAVQYRKKPVVIEAEQIKPTNVEDVATWCDGEVIIQAVEMDGIVVTYYGIDIPTLEGTMRGNSGDFVIQGVEGEFYPCKKDIFEKTYERVGLRLSGDDS